MKQAATDHYDDGESWPTYRRLILNQLESLETDIKDLHASDKEILSKLEHISESLAKQMTMHQSSLDKLEVKAGLWGALAAIIATVGYYFASKFR